MSVFDWLRTWSRSPAAEPKRSAANAARNPIDLVRHLADGGLRRLSDDDLARLVAFLVSDPTYRTPLRGNAKFCESVTRQYERKRTLSYKQRQAIYNILERAYPHNLVVDAGRYRD
jgi:hypothetical protein